MDRIPTGKLFGRGLAQDLLPCFFTRPKSPKRYFTPFQTGGAQDRYQKPVLPGSLFMLLLLQPQAWWRPGACPVTSPLSASGLLGLGLGFPRPVSFPEQHKGHSPGSGARAAAASCFVSGGLSEGGGSLRSSRLRTSDWDSCADTIWGGGGEGGSSTSCTRNAGRGRICPLPPPPRSPNSPEQEQAQRGKARPRC